MCGNYSFWLINWLRKRYLFYTHILLWSSYQHWLHCLGVFCLMLLRIRAVRNFLMFDIFQNNLESIIKGWHIPDLTLKVLLFVHIWFIVKIFKSNSLSSNNSYSSQIVLFYFQKFIRSLHLNCNKIEVSFLIKYITSISAFKDANISQKSFIVLTV